MKAVFADTFFFLAILNPADGSHEASVELSRSLSARWVTTAWVLTEVADAMSLPQHRGTFLKFLRSLEGNPGVTIIPASESEYRRGLELYGRRADKAWSLTDCISFVVMKDEGLRQALTGDRHFAQAGFEPLFPG